MRSIARNNFLRGLAALFVAAWSIPQANAYVLRMDASDIYTIKWPTSPITMQVRLAKTGILSDGKNRSSSVVACMEDWNTRLATVQFTWETPGEGTYSNGNRVSEIVMDSKIDGEDFSSGTLAVTITYAVGDRAVESDIVINTAYTWDSYPGYLRSTMDLRRVVTHELGHVLGLGHPDEHHQTVTALMNSEISDIDALQSDDISGAQLLYGVPGVLPTNDRFADATLVALSSGSRDLTATNVLATRDASEGNHASSTGKHSLWWRWTAPAAGTATISTFGSNFDTVLAAYRGGSVEALTEVASNDDEETPAQNSTPQRKRSSWISFPAVAGTTYYFAVDGWGSPTTSVDGYTGSIALNIAFAPNVPIPPGVLPTLANISARGYCTTGNGVTIGGFVVVGPVAKSVLIRAVGPSLAAQGLSASEVLQDPVIEVHRGTPVIAQNDNWSDNANAAEIALVATRIGANPLAAGDTKSSAVFLSLQPGVYSFIARGKNESSGIVLLEVYDADAVPTGSTFVDIATRAYATTGNGVAIGGFVISGNLPKQVLIRAVGPTLTTQGISQTEVLADPTIELHHGAATIGTNDDWGTNGNSAQIVATGARIGATPFASSDTKSAAMLLTLQPGVYSFIAQGKNATSGIVLVEVYDAD